MAASPFLYMRYFSQILKKKPLDSKGRQIIFTRFGATQDSIGVIALDETKEDERVQIESLDAMAKKGNIGSISEITGEQFEQIKKKVTPPISPAGSTSPYGRRQPSFRAMPTPGLNRVARPASVGGNSPAMQAAIESEFGAPFTQPPTSTAPPPPPTNKLPSKPNVGIPKSAPSE